MKVLFLDCDGVLNSHRDFEVVWDSPDNYFCLNRRAVERIQNIIRNTDCKIVLSSSWRNLDGGRGFLETMGIPIFDKTGRSEDGFRGKEIQAWLDSHPEVIQYAIVDDDGDMLDSQLKNFVQTTMEHGLTDSHEYRLEYILTHHS